jgi:hypothetical protein
LVMDLPRYDADDWQGRLWMASIGSCRRTTRHK